jgi:hypothetical protein
MPGGYTSSERVYANIYEAGDKEEVKRLLLADVDYITVVRQKLSPSVPQYERFITSIHALNEQWERIWLTEHTCKHCGAKYTLIEKTKFATRGTAEFCSIDCQKEYQAKFDPISVDNWDTASVYRITHKPTGLFYIGVTSRWIMQRWWEHIKAESGSRFHQFIKEHDLTEFTFEVLETFKPSEVNPYEREAYYITLHDAINKGLNTASAHSVVGVGESVL